MNQAAVVDEIYEAAVAPEFWTRTLDRMAEIAGGEGTLLFAASSETSQLICSPTIEPFVRRWITEGWVGRNERGSRLIPIQEPRFLTDLDGFTPEELDQSPYYTEFLRPIGFGWCAGTAIRTPNDDTIVFSIERLYKKGPVEPDAVTTLDALRPHLARAAVLAARVGLERARTSVLALETIGLPAAVLTLSGRVVAANGLFGGLSPAIAIRAHDALGFESRATQSLFAAALAEATYKRFAMAARSLPLPGNEANVPAVVHLLPLRGAGRDLFSGAALLLYVTALSRSTAPPTGLLQVLFDLSPAEARVASLIGQGNDVKRTASQLAVKEETVRSHLKSVFQKTGTRRQAELVRLLTIPSGPADSQAGG